MKKREAKNLKQIIITIALILVISLVEYYLNQNQNENIETSTTESVSTNIKIDEIPKYSGKIVIDINNNKPYFEEKDMKTEDFEYYSELDELGRGQVAFANICKLTMPPKGTKRDSLSYKPSGWNQVLYGKNKSEHLYERCHLIAWQLGNENNNKKNLITGTSQMNEAMIPLENQVANWIKEKNNKKKDYHVLYRVTPIYKDKNLVATGVEIEAKSVEEEGISFNKFIYNVQDNFEIDYKTGKAKLLE